MCTAACFNDNGLYFGRTLDYEFSYGEEIVILPRNKEIEFFYEGTPKSCYAIIGTAHVEGNYPMFYDAANECGLCMAGLNFVGNARYNEFKQNAKNVAQYEFIIWILRQCKSVCEAKELLISTNITDKPFSDKLPAAQLHWMIADKSECITVEATKDGLNIYENPTNVMTNNPPFPFQMFALNNYASLSPKQPEINFGSELDIKLYSRGMGAIGLPGDWSSGSRFVRAAFVRANSSPQNDEQGSVGRLFHILGSVNQVKGCCDVDGKYEYTIYTSCISADKGIYYYKTYDGHRICAVDMHKENLDSAELIRFPMIDTFNAEFLN